MIKEELLRYKWNLFRVITWKLLFNGVRNDTFDWRQCNFNKGAFPGGENE